MRNRTVCFAALLSLGAAACGGGGGGGSSTTTGGGGTVTGPNTNDPAPMTANTVNANPSLDYNPSSLTVARGTTVTFVFGNIGHSVTFDNSGGPADLPVSVNTSVGVAFTSTGVFTYHCTVHNNMHGSITVQ
jgi:plastocyanin